MKHLFVFLVIIALVFPTAWADGNSDSLSSLTSLELNELLLDIDSAINIYHTPTYEDEHTILELVKSETDAYYTSIGYVVSWPWFDYTYTKDWNLYTFETKLEYIANDGKTHKPKVYAELLLVDGSFEICYIKTGQEVLIDNQSCIPDILWDDSTPSLLNAATQKELSALSLVALGALKADAQKELNINHSTDYETSETVLELTQKAVHDYFIGSGAEISWPWLGYDYTREWSLYTLTTRIDYADVDNAEVYAEAYPVDGEYILCYLTIGNSVVLDNRGILPDNLSSAVPLKAIPPCSSEVAKGQEYEKVVAQFERAGFTNITTQEVAVSIWGGDTPGTVSMVRINGVSSFDRHDSFKVDSNVCIEYFVESNSTYMSSTTLSKHYARDAFKDYGKARYPNGFSCHWLLDLIHEEQLDDGSWYFKVGTSAVDSDGIERYVIAEGVVEGTDTFPKVTQFNVNPK